MDKFGLDIKLMIAQVTNFFIFYFVFKKFMAKPFSAFIKNEKKKEAEKEKMMNELDEKYERMKAEEKEWQLQMQNEKEKVINETKKVAEQLKSDTLQQAKQEATEMVQKAEKQISSEREDLYNEVKKRTIDLSTYIVEKGLKEYLTEDAKKDLTKHIVNNLGKDVSKYEN
jgi:F-type H+-transporting ATPase subunit b